MENVLFWGYIGLYEFLAPELRSRKFGYTDFACIVTKSSRGVMVYFRARVDRVMEFWQSCQLEFSNIGI